VTDEELWAVLEAARWAPSANNGQPWRFIVGRTNTGVTDESFKALFSSLMPGNQAWANNAPILIAAVALGENPDGSPRNIASYELGLAVAQLTTQAEFLGLKVHQMAGFDKEVILSSFSLTSGADPIVVLALGHLGDPSSLPDWAKERESAPRERLPLSEVALVESWDALAA
jgi:nitroreductase